MACHVTRLTLFALFVLAPIVDLHAQPALQVHTGVLTFSRGSTRPSVALGAEALEVNAVFDDGSFEAEECSPCVAGYALRIDARVTATGKGREFYAADFRFAGDAIQVPDNGLADLVLTAPFTFHGRIIAADRRDAVPESADRRSEVEGGGTVTVRLSSTVDPVTGQRLYVLQDLTYQFFPTR